MADDDYTAHGFASYNKGYPIDGAPTLVGNWTEERSLQDMTGVTRYETFLKPEGEPQVGDSPYATLGKGAPDMLTRPRVIDHLDNQHPANWSSVKTVSYPDPNARKDMAAYTDLDKLGPRARREMEAMLAEASDLPDAVQHTLTGKPADRVMDSTYRAHFDEKDSTGLMIGTRVIKDRDGRPAQRDPTFLAETQICPRADVDRYMLEQGTMAGATQTSRMRDPNIPVTIYSESVATGKYGDTFNATRPMEKTAPFNKYANFSKPMGEYNKVVVDE
eukprot:gene7565-718_t